MGQFMARYFQEGTDAPTHEVLRNSAGISISYVRLSAGQYQGTITPQLPVGSFVLRHNSMDEYGEKSVGVMLSGSFTLSLATRENGTQKDDLFNETDFILEIVTPD